RFQRSDKPAGCQGREAQEGLRRLEPEGKRQFDLYRQLLPVLYDRPISEVEAIRFPGPEVFRMQFKQRFSRFFLIFVAAAFSASAIAAAMTDGKSKGNEPAREPGSPAATGMVIGSGELKVNDSRVMSGATITSGSIVSTGPDGDASIDLGPVGHLRLRPNTSVKLVFGDGSCEISMEHCGSLTAVLPDGISSQVNFKEEKLTQVAATKGEAVVDGVAMAEGGNAKTLHEGETRTYSKVAKVTARGDAAFSLNCCGDCKVPPTLIGPPVYGIVGFVGAAAATVRGLTPGDKPPRPEVSPVQ